MELLFENIKVYGRYVRTNGLNGLNGLEYWNKIKKFIQKPEQLDGMEKINEIISSIGWTIDVKIGSSTNSNIEQIYDYVHGDKKNQLKIFGEEGDEEDKALEHDIWEQYHFFLQLIRIPKNNPEINLIRLLQIAYNLGQLSVYIGDGSGFRSRSGSEFEANSVISFKAQQYFKLNNLDKLESYVKINGEQESKLETDLAVGDFISNVNDYILEQMNLVQARGNSGWGREWSSGSGGSGRGGSGRGGSGGRGSGGSGRGGRGEWSSGSGEEVQKIELEPFYSPDIEKLTKDNNDYRRVIYTGKNQQFVLMSIPVGDSIKMEVHKNHDQFVRIEEGEGLAKIGTSSYKLSPDSAFIVPAGVKHEITNISTSKSLKLYTIYSPPEHPDKLVQRFNPNTSNMVNIVDFEDHGKKIETNFPKVITGGYGGYGGYGEKKIDYEKKYAEYKNKYIALKKFISKYN